MAKAIPEDPDSWKHSWVLHLCRFRDVVINLDKCHAGRKGNAYLRTKFSVFPWLVELGELGHVCQHFKRTPAWEAFVRTTDPSEASCSGDERSGDERPTTRLSLLALSAQGDHEQELSSPSVLRTSFLEN